MDAIFGILITLSMAQNVIEVLLGSPTGGSEYLSTGFALAASIPLLIAAFVFSVLVIRMNRHAIWGWVAMVLAMFWPIVLVVFNIDSNTGAPDRAYADTVEIELRYGPLLIWTALLGLIGIHLNQARKAGVLN